MFRSVQFISFRVSLPFAQNYLAVLKLIIMMKMLVSILAIGALLSAGRWTMNDQETIDNTLPTTTTPSAMVGEWSSGYTSFAQVDDAYNGLITDHSWQRGKYIKITLDGKNAAFYTMTENGDSTIATQISGTVRFDAESTNSRGSFTFLALRAHYKGFGNTKLDRDATQEELKKNLTRKYHYRMDGEWLRIEPNGEPNDYSSSFRKTEQ